MSIERISGNNGDQGPMSPWEGLAAALINYGSNSLVGLRAIVMRKTMRRRNWAGQ